MGAEVRKVRPPECAQGEYGAVGLAFGVHLGKSESDVEHGGLHVHAFTLRIHGIGLFGEVVEIGVTHPGDAVLAPFRSPSCS
jgi:hypothetical protein